jgi:hypothetical protein
VTTTWPFHSQTRSLREEVSWPPSDPEHPSHPDASASPFACEAGLLRARIYDEGVFGCFGIGRISRIAPGPFEHGRATSRVLGWTPSGHIALDRLSSMTMRFLLAITAAISSSAQAVSSLARSALPVPAGGAARRRSGRCRLAHGADWSGAQKQRFDKLGDGPVDRTAAREPLLADRVLAGEPKHQSWGRSVERRHHSLEPGNLLGCPPSPTRLGIRGYKPSAIGLVHSSAGGNCSAEEQGLVRNHEWFRHRLQTVTQSSCRRTGTAADKSSSASRCANLTLVRTTSRTRLKNPESVRSPRTGLRRAITSATNDSSAPTSRAIRSELSSVMAELWCVLTSTMRCSWARAL